MQNLSYISTLVPKKVSLAEESWQVFSQFLCRYQWASDDPSHSPRASEITHAILNRGKPGACTFSRPEGYRYILPVLHSRHFEDAIAHRRKIYYVSYGKQSLLYLDVDLHYAWQKLTDGQEAKQKLDGLLRKFFGDAVLFWSPSSRGFNGFLKVDLKGMDYAFANNVFDRLEAALQLFLASCNNMADLEIKGKLGFMQKGQYQWTQYGKLPIHHPDWNFSKLEEFKKTASVSIHKLGILCDIIEAQVPHEVLTRHQERKISLGDTPIFDKDYFLVTPAIDKAMTEKHGEAWRYLFGMWKGGEEETWLHKTYYRPGRTPLTERELREARPCIIQADLPRNHLRPVSKPKDQDSLQHQLEAVFHRMDTDPPQDDDLAKQLRATLFDRIESGNYQDEQPRPRKKRDADLFAENQEPLPPRLQRQSVMVNMGCDDMACEGDSFKRQKEAMFRLARYLKRVPTLDEALGFIHDKNLFTGSWDQHQARRKVRVRDILTLIASTFDPSKCANGSVNVGKYDTWAATRFPNGLVGGKRGYLTDDGLIVRVKQNIHFSPRFIGVFMAVAEFALLIDRNQDDTLPHNRANELWDALFAKGLISVKFCSRKWAVCREELVKHGIIAITDRNYGPGNAMKWAPGLYFPFLGLWKSQKQPSLLGPVDLASFLQRKNKKRTEQHNTLLQSQSVQPAVLDRWRFSRPPPLAVVVS